MHPAPETMAPLESIVFNEDLRTRPYRAPDYERENRVLSALIRALADAPQAILQTLVEKILEVLDVDSAGMSLLMTIDGEERFYWPAIAGKWKCFIGSGTPRSFGPCGDVLDRNCALLFRGLERHYPYYEPVEPCVEECLLIPFYVEGKAVGTLWIVAHDKRRQFDSENLRQMESLAQFASMAYKTVNLLKNLSENADRLEARETDLRNRLSELQRTSEELHRANLDLNHFAYAASHDLQEPLRTIAIFSQLLLARSEERLGEEAISWGKLIVESCRRMSTLLSDLRAYAQSAGGDRDPAEIVDLNTALAEASENLKTAIETSGAAITHDPLPSVRGHGTHLVMLIQNLIGNSIKYRSDLPPRVHLAAAMENRAWHIVLSDNGIGIDPQYHRDIFGVFRRLHGQDIPGTGIGLAICQRIVERCGGRIWVESEAGKGAAFHFTLPVADQIEK